MILLPIFSMLILSYFAIRIILQWKRQPVLSRIFLITLISRLLGIAIYLYLMLVSPDPKLAKLRFTFDYLTYISLLVFIFLKRKSFTGNTKAQNID